MWLSQESGEDVITDSELADLILLLYYSSWPSNRNLAEKFRKYLPEGHNLEQEKKTAEPTTNV